MPPLLPGKVLKVSNGGRRGEGGGGKISHVGFKLWLMMMAPYPDRGLGPKNEVERWMNGWRRGRGMDEERGRVRSKWRREEM